MIKDEESHQRALKELKDLLQTNKNTQKIDVLSDSIEKYEKQKHHIPPVSINEIIKFCMDQNSITYKKLAQNLNMDETDLENKINGKLKFSVEELKKIHTELHIPFEMLCQE